MTFTEFLKKKIKPYNFYWADADVTQPLEFPFDITAKEFVSFANRDLDEDGKHGLVNALSNAKRAIDCQIDAVTSVLGIKKQRSFPKKADNFVKLGLLAPRVIKRINQQRNYLEHEYKIPNAERVEDAVDTATLFVELTQRIFRSFRTSYTFGGTENFGHSSDYGKDFVSVNFSPSTKVFYIECTHNGKIVVQEEIDASRQKFIPLLKLTLSSDWSYSDLSDQETIEELIASC